MRDAGRLWPLNMQMQATTVAEASVEGPRSEPGGVWLTQSQAWMIDDRWSMINDQWLMK